MVKWIHQKEKEVDLNIIKFIISISVLVLVIKNREFLRELENRITVIENFIYRKFGSEFELLLRKDKNYKK